jgi:hypothetical protein
MRFIIRTAQVAFYGLFLTLVGPVAPGSRRTAGPF